MNKSKISRKDLEKYINRFTKEVKNYYSFEKVAKEIISPRLKLEYSLKYLENKVNFSKKTTFITLYTFYQVAEAGCIHYYVSPDILSALVDSDFEVSFKSILWSIKSGILMFPFNFIKSPGNLSVNYISFYIRDDGVLFWVASDSKHCFCRKYQFCDDSEKVSLESISQIFSKKDIATFNNSIQNILFKLMLLMQSRPEYIDKEDNKPIQKGFAKISEFQTYRPLWFGKDYIYKTKIYGQDLETND